jgi:hypothetical protein
MEHKMNKTSYIGSMGIIHTPVVVEKYNGVNILILDRDEIYHSHEFKFGYKKACGIINKFDEIKQFHKSECFVTMDIPFGLDGEYFTITTYQAGQIVRYESLIREFIEDPPGGFLNTLTPLAGETPEYTFYRKRAEEYGYL